MSLLRPLPPPVASPPFGRFAVVSRPLFVRRLRRLALARLRRSLAGLSPFRSLPPQVPSLQFWPIRRRLSTTLRPPAAPPLFCPASLFAGSIMASSDGLSLDALERELDAEEFSLLHRPSSASAMSSAPSSVRGEFSITPSSARVGSTRSFGGGEC